MKIRYDLGIEDLVAFTCYHNDHSPAVRRIRLFVTLAGVAPFLVLPVLLAPREYRVIALAGGAAAAAVIAYRMPGAYARATERQVRRLYGAWPREGIFGAHELELAPPRLLRRMPAGESATLLEALGPL